jgi:glycosyltransferase involved in cell wall biosynthesis
MAGWSGRPTRVRESWLMQDEITALVLTRNEGPNIARTLQALSWVKQLLVLDSFSTDKTLDLVKSIAPHATVLQRPFDSFAGQCNFGLSQITTEWVLSIDADYVLTPTLIAEIAALDPTADVAGYSVEFRYCIFGRPLRSTLYPARTVLYQRKLANYRDEGHGHRVAVDGKVEKLSSKIDHDDRKPFSQWIWTQDQYAIIEAQHLLWKPIGHLSFPDRLRRRIFFAPMAIFFYLLFWRWLILDGWPGWFYVFQRTVAELLLSIRLLIEREGLEPNDGA